MSDQQITKEGIIIFVNQYIKGELTNYKVSESVPKNEAQLGLIQALNREMYINHFENFKNQTAKKDMLIM